MHIWTRHWLLRLMYFSAGILGFAICILEHQQTNVEFKHDDCIGQKTYLFPNWCTACKYNKVYHV